MSQLLTLSKGKLYKTMKWILKLLLRPFSFGTKAGLLSDLFYDVLKDNESEFILSPIKPKTGEGLLITICEDVDEMIATLDKVNQIKQIQKLNKFFKEAAEAVKTAGASADGEDYDSEGFSKEGVEMEIDEEFDKRLNDSKPPKKEDMN